MPYYKLPYPFILAEALLNVNILHINLLVTVEEVIMGKEVLDFPAHYR